MKPADINQLIEKFYAGETSVQEETQLRDYFEQANIPANHLSAKLHFIAANQLAEEEMGEDFEENLMSQLVDEKPVSIIKIWTYRLTSAAAIILLMLAIWFGTDLLQPKEVYGTITDPKLAFAETQKVLDEVSKKMNKGLQPAKKTVDKVEDNVKQAGKIKKINSALKQAKKVNKYEEASELLKSMSKVQVRIGNS